MGNDNLCYKCSDNCERCQDINKCEVCISEEYSINPEGKCVSCTDKCYKCENYTSCRTCKFPFAYTLYKGKCVNCGEYCSECLNEVSCAKCIYEKDKPYNGKCIECTLDKCKFCSSKNFCEECESLYINDNGKCILFFSTKTFILSLIFGFLGL